MNLNRFAKTVFFHSLDWAFSHKLVVLGLVVCVGVIAAAMYGAAFLFWYEKVYG